MKRSMWTLVLVLVAMCYNMVACEPPCNDGKCDDGNGAVDPTPVVEPSCTVTLVETGKILACKGSDPVLLRDGKDGVDGVGCKVIGAATNGCTPTMCGDTYVPICNGVNGKDGTNGTNGVNGKDGTSCTVVDNGDGTKIVSCDDGTSVIVTDGKNGTDGVDGKDGDDFAKCDLAHPCTDGEQCNSQGICVIPGHDGATGATGPQGPAGTNGTNGTSFVKCSTVHPCAANEQCNSQGICVIPDFVGCIENASCDDGNPCTTEDVCRTGICTGGSVNDCDDGNPATTDTCVAWIGCFNTQSTGCTTDAQCDDGDPATSDKCSAGKCVYTQSQFVCFGLQFKIPTTATCVGWPAEGGVNWTSTSVVPDANGWYSAPNGVCSVTCSTKPSACRGEWSEDQVKPWQNTGCSHLFHPWDGTWTTDGGCTFDNENCQ